MVDLRNLEPLPAFPLMSTGTLESEQLGPDSEHSTLSSVILLKFLSFDASASTK